MQRFIQTVTGLVKKEDMGITLVHEHLFNDLSSVVDEPYYAFSSFLKDKKVSADLQWGLRYDPYCCCDNMNKKDLEDVIYEVNSFIELGGRTIVDATGSQAIGRDVKSLAEVADRTGLNIIASSGLYLEKFERGALTQCIETLAENIDRELNIGIDDTTICAGMIGEIGVSPAFTENEKNNLRAASLAQTNNPNISMNIHMPGWQRRGDEVLNIILKEFPVNPQKVSLAHSDPSGKDLDYQRRLLDMGVWLEFDMIGLDISFPKEGVAPGVMDTINTVYKLIELGYAKQIVLSHDVFLKQMWVKNGGNGWGFVPNVFLSLLSAKGVDHKIIERLCTVNPANLLA